MSTLSNVRRSFLLRGARRPESGTALARFGTALAATSLGALALGAVAVGALAIRVLAVKRARIQRLELVIGGRPFVPAAPP